MVHSGSPSRSTAKAGRDTSPFTSEQWLSPDERAAAARDIVVYAGTYTHELSVTSRAGVRLPSDLWRSPAVRAAVQTVEIRTDPNSNEHARLPRWLGRLPKVRVLVDHGQIEESRGHVIRSKTSLLNREEPLPECTVFVTCARTPLLPVPLRHVARLVLLLMSEYGVVVSPRGWAAHLRPFFVRDVEITFIVPPNWSTSGVGAAGAIFATQQLLRGIGDVVRDIPAQSRSRIYIVNAVQAFAGRTAYAQQALAACDAVKGGTLDLNTLVSRVKLLSLDEYRAVVGDKQYALELAATTPFHLLPPPPAHHKASVGPYAFRPKRRSWSWWR